MKREIVVIDEDKCIGCGLCIPNCHEGALQIIDGKARLISDLYCDGLGACVGHCPVDAMKIEMKDVDKYDERKVMIDNIIPAGANTIKAHLQHLLDHNAMEFYKIGVDTLKELGVKNPLEAEEKENPAHQKPTGGGCPGSKMMSFAKKNKGSEVGEVGSELAQWPVQLHLVSPFAPYFNGADLLLAADCTAFAVGDFHSKHLKNKALAIACPKLDSSQDSYVEKLVSMIDNNNLNSVTCMIMEVPCCGGLLAIAKQAVGKAKRKVPLKVVVVGIKGEILKEEWV